MKESPAACPACAMSGNLQRVSSGHGYRILRCTGCTLELASPMKIPPGFYDQYEQPSGWKWEFDAFLKREPARKRNLLDVGCGDGHFLAMAQKAGYVVHGFDSSRSGVGAARKRGIRNLHSGSLDDFLRSHRGRFDVVTCFHTLEHVEDPSGFIRKVAAFARPRGIIAIGVPNARRFVVQLRREISDYPPNHLTRWNRGALRIFLTRHGLHIREVAPEIIRLSSAKESTYVLWLAVNALTQTGLLHRQRMRTLGVGRSQNPHPSPLPFSERESPPLEQKSGGIQGSLGIPLSVLRGISGRVRPAIQATVQRSLGGLLLRFWRNRELQGPGLLAIAEKPAR